MMEELEFSYDREKDVLFFNCPGCGRWRKIPYAEKQLILPAGTTIYECKCGYKVVTGKPPDNKNGKDA